MIRIAKKHGITLKQLVADNAWIKDPHWIYPGQILKIAKTVKK